MTNVQYYICFMILNLLLSRTAYANHMGFTCYNFSGTVEHKDCCDWPGSKMADNFEAKERNSISWSWTEEKMYSCTNNWHLFKLFYTWSIIWS